MRSIQLLFLSIFIIFEVSHAINEDDDSQTYFELLRHENINNNEDFTYNDHRKYRNTLVSFIGAKGAYPIVLFSFSTMFDETMKPPDNFKNKFFASKF